MFLNPRIHIISKGNMLTDLLWYITASRLNNQLSLSLNNTSHSPQNTLSTLHLLKLLHRNHPNLNLLILNSKTSGELLHHLHADHKYVLF
jgi:hypothetical protein